METKTNLIKNNKELNLHRESSIQHHHIELSKETTVARTRAEAKAMANIKVRRATQLTARAASSHAAPSAAPRDTGARIRGPRPRPQTTPTGNPRAPESYDAPRDPNPLFFPLPPSLRLVFLRAAFMKTMDSSSWRKEVVPLRRSFSWPGVPRPFPVQNAVILH